MPPEAGFHHTLPSDHGNEHCSKVQAMSTLAVIEERTRWPSRHIDSAEEPWWVVRTLPRQEKALAEDLLEREIEFYLPVYTKVVRRKDNGKPRKSVHPLFPGYICVSTAKSDLAHVHMTNRTVNVITVRNQPRFIDELQQIYRTFELGAPIEPYSTELATFEIGDEVTVRSGPLRGLAGTILRKGREAKLMLRVDSLGFAAVAVHACDVVAA